ncbi:hypothetical protein MRB53_032117 [Persea americana]|uniref:Uncharacterized protein n=1 Tax=Persea americana TaxID=3435 RepID=A0ACC2KQZ0_PERAE|nr:hypothetical protein MRB53_032117 [Persea americana]
MEGHKEVLSEEGFTSHKIWNQRRGGLRATMFLYVMTGLENMAFVANVTSLVLYFILVFHFGASEAATTVTNFLGGTFLLSILGGFISDTYMSRLNTCLIFGLLEVLGYVLVTIQAHYPKLHPSTTCVKDCLKGGASIMFYSSLCLLALGGGGVRGAFPSLGADQYDQSDPKERKQMASFFNFMMLSVTMGATIGVTVIVKVSMDKGWDKGFFISSLAAFVGFAVLILGKPFYRPRVPGDSPLIRVMQVIVAAFRNRRLSLPEDSDELYELKEAYVDGGKIPHTNQFRLLDKAAILPNGSTPEPGRVCTVTQVEEFKILTRMMPIIGSTIIMNTCLAQLQTFSVQQGNYMDLHLGSSSFKVPPPSIPVIPLVFMAVLIPIYEFFFVPFARKITKHPSGITHLQRVGVGLVLSVFSMGVAGMIEVKRRDALNIDHKQISIFWLSFQYAIFGIADMFTLIGLLEFFYSEAPAGMRSLSTSFAFLSLSFGFFLSSAFVGLINSVTRRVTESKRGWLEGDLNENKLNLFYWFLAILSCLNFGNYLFWASWYKYKADEMTLEGSPIKKETVEVFTVENGAGSSVFSKGCSEAEQEGQ